jgi:hypothetical protein
MAEHFCESVDMTCCCYFAIVVMRAGRGCWRLSGEGEYLGDARTGDLWSGY